VSWKKLWLLFTVIWVVVTGLQAVTILAVGEEPPEKAWRPLLLMVVVPVLLYVTALAWQWLRRGRRLTK
jgi:membrane protein DedA with SNARE-associated domain